MKLPHFPTLVSPCGGHGVAFVRLSEPVTTTTPLARPSLPPAAGDACTVIGHGPDADNANIGQQRSATMTVTATEACGGLVAKGVTGSVAVGSLDGMLL